MSARSLFKIAKRGFFTSHQFRKSPDEFLDIKNLTTGLQKKELLAFESGNDDPFHLEGMKRGIGTREKPNLIPSAFEERLVGCICHEDNFHISYMWLYKGEPRRCMCGYWFELVYEAPIE